MAAAKKNNITDSGLKPDPLKPGIWKNRILVNGVEVAWDIESGQCTFRGIPVAMMWVDSTLVGLMAGVEAMVGPERFILALQAEGRKSVESDWMLISSFPNFREGFAALNLNAAVAGWGDWRLIDYDAAGKRCVFRAYNNWEGLYQKALGVCWGSGLLAGKFAGICTKLFQTNCWANQTAFVARGDDYDEFDVIQSPVIQEDEIDKLLISDRSTRADMAVALKKLRDTEAILRAEIAERKRAANELRIAATAFDSQEAMVITDINTVILRVNKTFAETTGYSAQEVVGKKINILKSGWHDRTFYAEMWHDINTVGVWQGEIWDRRKNGEIYPKWLTITAVKDETGAVTHYIGAHIDITERKAAEDEIKQLAFYDPLTGLPNRRLLRDRLQQTLAAHARGKTFGAVLFIDMDNFKTLNDTLGHDKGDQLLRLVANRIAGCVRDVDTVARLGGDEFVVLLEYLDGQSDEAAMHTKLIGEKIFAWLNQPYELDGHYYRSTASIGATLFSDEGASIDELLRQADIAMYQAKAAGRNTMRFFDPSMQTMVIARANLEEDLHMAIQEKQFVLYYQPQVDHDKHITGAEALLRWPHPQRGMVSPAEFIPLAEETGLILHLGQWVMEAACAQLAAWTACQETADLTIAVNVSVCQFRQADFVDSVLSAIENSGANPARLKLELTESLLATEVEDIIAKMTLLKAQGISFALDDFGTGYSSLYYLKLLPLDQLKIDQGFVRDILTDVNDAAIAKMIVALADTMGLGVIAEGVENEAQRDFLVNHGCHDFQGYLFGKPVPIKAFEALLPRTGDRNSG